MFLVWSVIFCDLRLRPCASLLSLLSLPSRPESGLQIFWQLMPHDAGQSLKGLHVFSDKGCGHATAWPGGGTASTPVDQIRLGKSWASKIGLETQISKCTASIHQLMGINGWVYRIQCMAGHKWNSFTSFLWLWTWLDPWRGLCPSTVAELTMLTNAD